MAARRLQVFCFRVDSKETAVPSFFLTSLKRTALLALLLLAAACGGLAPAPASPTPAAALPSDAPQSVRRFDPADVLRFEHISIEEGLSQSTVRCILQDRRGFIWFGTEDGLNRFDGYGFKVYRHDPDNAASLGNNAIQALYEDSSGSLWVGTEGRGLDKLDRETEQFTHYRAGPEDWAGLSHDYIHALYEDKTGVLWIGTGGGLSRVDLKLGRWTNYRQDTRAPDAIRRGSVDAILESRAGILWFGTSGGLIRYHQGENAFATYRHDPADPASLSLDAVSSVAEDATGALWVGTYGGGVNILDAESTRFTRLQSQRDDPTTLSSNNIAAIHLDRSGTLWVATADRGINRLDPKQNRFVRYAREADNPTSLSNDNVRSLYEDRSGVIWIGTFGGGASKWDPTSARFTHYRIKPGEPTTQSHNVVFSVHADSPDVVWIGTERGLNRLDRVTGQFAVYQHDPDTPNSLGHNVVRVIYRDRKGTLWVGTEGGGLNRFDAATDQFRRYLHDARDPASLSSNIVAALYEDESGNLWVGTSRGLDRLNRTTGEFAHPGSKADDPATASGSSVLAILPERSGGLWVATTAGLIKFDPGTGQATRHVHNPNDANSLSGNFVLDVHQDRSGIVWIGTYTEGLNRLDPATGQFTHYREKQGLPNDTVYAILEDTDGFLWLSTNKGIAKFDPSTDTFRTYDADDGLQGNEFNWGAHHASAHGELFFGGINGLTAFYPADIRDDPSVPPVVLTQLTQAGESLHLRQAVENVREITLPWPNNFFEFEFAALDFSRSRKSQYAYRLEGFEQHWNELGNRHAGRYTNLPGGTYTLRVIASNGDGVWNQEGASLRVVIVPPVWDAWWLRGLLGVLLVASVLAGYRLRSGNIRAHNRALQQQVDRSTWALQQRSRALERQQEELQALYQADEELHHHLHLDDVLQALVDLAVDRLKADKSAVLTWDKQQDQLVMRVSRGFGQQGVESLRFARGQMYAGRVLETGEPILVEDTTVDPRTLQRRAEISQAAQAEDVRSLMHLPIKIGEQVFGVFNVSYTQPRAFGAAEQQLFTALAQRAALAIQGASHFDAEQRRAEQFQIIADMGRRVSALLDAHQVLDQVVASLRHAFGYYHVGIGLVEGDEVVYRAGSGVLWDDPNFGFKPPRLKIGKEGITGWVAAHGEPLIIPDVSQEPRYVLMQGSATRSELTVPIIVKGQVIGVLDVQSDQLDAFDSTDLAVVQSIASQTGAAIENARLYEHAQELAVMQERNRLARDLHDAVTQTLFSASLLADALPSTWENDPKEGRQLLRELRQLSRGALAEMRTLLLELRPAALVETNLGALLRQLGEAAAGRENLQVDVRVAADAKLPPEAHIALYRIAQEALNNILKHARASRVTISLHCRPGDQGPSVELLVADDGRGFDPAQVPPGHLGLCSMRERAQAIGAEWTVTSAPGHGTQVRVAWESKESVE